jgi:hypothetical protein
MPSDEKSLQKPTLHRHDDYCRCAERSIEEAAEEFVQNLAARLRKMPLPLALAKKRAESNLKKHYLLPAVRSFTAKALGVLPEQLDAVVISNGDSRAEKKRWSDSKADQNVVVFDCPNTTDIFIKHEKIGTISIEIKASKFEGVPGDLQRAIGQSLIASMRHTSAICLAVRGGRPRRTRTDDAAAKLVKALWENHRIALVVRGLGKQ